MSWEFLRKEWGAVTFVVTVLIGLVVVPLSLYFGNQSPAAAAAPATSATTSATTSAATSSSTTTRAGASTTTTSRPTGTST